MSPVVASAPRRRESSGRNHLLVTLSRVRCASDAVTYNHNNPQFRLAKFRPAIIFRVSLLFVASKSCWLVFCIADSNIRPRMKSTVGPPSSMNNTGGGSLRLACHQFFQLGRHRAESSLHRSPSYRAFRFPQAYRRTQQVRRTQTQPRVFAPWRHILQMFDPTKPSEALQARKRLLHSALDS